MKLVQCISIERLEMEVCKKTYFQSGITGMVILENKTCMMYAIEKAWSFFV